MTAEETAGLLASQRKVQLATNGPDGFPHLVTMYYVMINGKIAFWTYRSSQKARNLERDPRISCLVETGEQYFDLRGMLLQGTATRTDDPAEVAWIGRQITTVLSGPGAQALSGAGTEADLAEYVERAARKRCGYFVEPNRVISWNHAKLLA
ncbi:MAG TPA: pyridoxamine 5'-phosphate oxidase family protein [Streptosporangiaceae bacterium]|nr:pyridoxamine 5'-phosphate oxidase family protein [Streptosporangiaceae bacterium]